MNTIQEGNYGWAAFSAGLTLLGVGGLRSSARELNQAIKVSDKVADYQRVLNSAMAHRKSSPFPFVANKILGKDFIFSNTGN